MFGARFPDRCFDVGIAEQHAVTFAAGLAADGMKPFAAIYSTFLQRGYDQRRPRRRDPKAARPLRASTAPASSAPMVATHAGSFDIGFLGALPGFVLMAAVR